MKIKQTIQTTIRIKFSTLKIVKETMKEKNFNRAEALEYIIHSYNDFIKNKNFKIMRF